MSMKSTVMSSCCRALTPTRERVRCDRPRADNVDNDPDSPDPDSRPGPRFPPRTPEPDSSPGLAAARAPADVDADALSPGNDPITLLILATARSAAPAALDCLGSAPSTAASAAASASASAAPAARAPAATSRAAAAAPALNSIAAARAPGPALGPAPGPKPAITSAPGPAPNPMLNPRPAAAATPACALTSSSPALGPARCCSSRHRKCIQLNKRRCKRVTMTWRAITARPYPATAIVT